MKRKFGMLALALLSACSTRPTILGADEKCLDRRSAYPKEIAEANGWKIHRVLVAKADHQRGLAEDQYINFVEVPPEFVCPKEESND